MTMPNEGFILPAPPPLPESIANLVAAKQRLEERRAFIAKIEAAKGSKQCIPEYCAYVVEILETGTGLMAFCKIVGASKAIVKKWAKENPEFADALDEAIAARGAFWEQELIRCSASGKSTTAAQWALKNIDPEEYKDKTEVVATNLNHNIDREATIKSIRDKFKLVSGGDAVSKSGGDASQ